LLEELAKRDNEWRKIATHICKDRNIADEITQQMYIKCYNHLKKGKTINTWYIYQTLKSCFIDLVRKSKKTISIELIRDIENKYTSTNISDIEEYENILVKLENGISQLKFYNKEVLMLNNGRTIEKGKNILIVKKQSFRKLSQETSIPVNSLFKASRDAKDKLRKHLEPEYKKWQQRKQA